MKNFKIIGLLIWLLASTSLFAQIGLVKDINPDGSGIVGSELVVFQNKLFFSAFNAETGRELWVSDGTEVGTNLLKDINSGSLSSSPKELTVAGNYLFFIATTETEGIEIWRTDGTSDGTVLVEDIISGDNTSTPRYLTAANEKLFFEYPDPESGRELFVISGTGLPQRISDFRRFGGSSLSEFTALGDKIYFRTDSDSDSDGFELYTSDGSVEGTQIVKDIWAGGSNDGNPQNITAIDSILYFSAEDARDTEPWISNGTSAGTQILKELYTDQSSNPKEFTKAGEVVFFAANEDNSELWITDGTSENTIAIADINTASFNLQLENFTGGDNILYFSANSENEGRELWRSDGTTVGTYLLKDINPGSGGAGFSDTDDWLFFNNQLYFSADDGSSGEELWISDGTDGGTILVEINDGIGNSNPSSFVVFENEIYFTAFTSSTGTELYKYTPENLPPPEANSVSGFVYEFNTNDTNDQSTRLAGVSVVNTFTGIGTVTDIDGNYEIEAEAGHEIRFSFLGYNSFLVPVFPDEQSVYNIPLTAQESGEFSFSESFQLQAPAPASRDRFGSSMSMLGDSLLFASAPGFNNGLGNVHILRKNTVTSSWDIIQTLANSDPSNRRNFGFQITASQNYLFVSFSYVGSQPAIQIYKRNVTNGNQWDELKVIDAEQGGFSLFGTDSYANDSLFFVTGSNDDLYIYKKNQGGVDNWGGLKLLAGQAGSDFGRSMAFDGKTLAIGASQHDDSFTNQGKVWIYEMNNGGTDFTLEAELFSPFASTDGNFGSSVSIDDNRLLIAAYREPNEANRGGIAYLYEEGTSNLNNWLLSSRIKTPSSGDTDFSPSRVLIKNSNIFINSVYKKVNCEESVGILYHYKAVGLTPSFHQIITGTGTSTRSYFANDFQYNGGSTLVANAETLIGGADVKPGRLHFFNKQAFVAIRPTDFSILSVSNVSANSASFSTSFSADGSGTISEKGFAVSTSTNPTICDLKYLVGGSESTLDLIVSDLIAETTYYVRAFTVNEAGESYGEEVSFTTEGGSTIFNFGFEFFGLQENNPAGLTVGEFFSENPENATFEFIAGEGDTDNDVFTIDNRSLNINFTTNFEEKSSYSIRIKAETEEGEILEEIFIIEVNDVNEAPTDILISPDQISGYF